MVRFARVVALGAPHLITQRGNARRFILEGDTERRVHLGLLRQGLQRHGVDLIGCCLMSNHVGEFRDRGVSGQGRYICNSNRNKQ